MPPTGGGYGYPMIPPGYREPPASTGQIVNAAGGITVYLKFEQNIENLNGADLESLTVDTLRDGVKAIFDKAGLEVVTD